MKTGIITWSDKTISKVFIKEVEVYSHLPANYWLDYVDGEVHRPIIHPEWGIKDYIKSPILLPEALFFRVFTADITEQDKKGFDYRLMQYIRENFRESEWFEAETTFRSLSRLSGEDYIIKNYFNKV